MFTVVDQVLLKPLPYAHPERLVTIDEADIHGKTGTFKRRAYLDLRSVAASITRPSNRSPTTSSAVKGIFSTAIPDR